MTAGCSIVSDVTPPTPVSLECAVIGESVTRSGFSCVADERTHWVVRVPDGPEGKVMLFTYPGEYDARRERADMYRQAMMCLADGQQVLVRGFTDDSGILDAYSLHINEKEYRVR